MKHWERIADSLSKAGWTWGCSSHIDSTGRVLFTADAHRDNGKRFIVRADEKLAAFLELERITCGEVIEIRPHRNGWKVFEAPGVELCSLRNVRQSIMLKTARASALARFAFWIQVEQLNASFHLVRRIEDCVIRKLVLHRASDLFGNASHLKGIRKWAG